VIPLDSTSDGIERRLRDCLHPSPDDGTFDTQVEGPNTVPSAKDVGNLPVTLPDHTSMGYKDLLVLRG